MHVPRVPHRWNVTPSRAIAIQRELAGRVRVSGPRKAARLVAGIDVAFSPDGERCIAGAVLWDVRDAVVLERCSAVCPLRFPYVPGFLSFREAPAIVAALRRLRHEPDVLMCDGHGLAHPRRFGLACHIGVIVGRPTVGCAKSRLCGEHADPASRRGSQVPLTHGGEIAGAVLRTRDGVRPVYVSVGHLIDLATATRLTLDCAVRYRLPEPTRLADAFVGEVKRSALPA